VISDQISIDISLEIKNVKTRKVSSSIKTALKVSHEGWGQNLYVGGGKEYSQLRQPAGSLMRITLRVYVCNHQAYAHSLWWARPLFVEIWWVTSAQTRDTGTDFRQGTRITLDRSWGPSKFKCMTVWGHYPQRTPCLLIFPSDTNDIKGLGFRV